MIKPKIKSMIETDIELCKIQAQKRQGSHELFLKLTAKYNKLDENFSKGIQITSKALLIDGADYTNELKQIIEILNMYILCDEIPLTKASENSIKSHTTIIANKLSNKGNIGGENTQNTQKSFSVSIKNGGERRAWFWPFKKRK